MKRRVQKIRFGAVMLATVLCLSVMTGCSETEKGDNGKTAQISLEDRGLEVISILDQKIHNDTYVDLMSSATMRELDAFQELQKGNYDQPEHVYKISFSEDSVDNVLKLIVGSQYTTDGMSDELKKAVNGQAAWSFLNFRTSREGVEPLAVQGTFTAEKLFTAEEKNLLCIYLYAYPGSYPAAVVFTGAEDGATLARGGFLIVNDFAAGSPEEVEKSLFPYLYKENIEAGKVLGLKIEQLK